MIRSRCPPLEGAKGVDFYTGILKYIEPRSSNQNPKRLILLYRHQLEKIQNPEMVTL